MLALLSSSGKITDTASNSNEAGYPSVQSRWSRKAGRCETVSVSAVFRSRNRSRQVVSLAKGDCLYDRNVATEDIGGILPADRRRVSVAPFNTGTGRCSEGGVSKPGPRSGYLDRNVHVESVSGRSLETNRT